MWNIQHRFSMEPETYVTLFFRSLICLTSVKMRVFRTRGAAGIQRQKEKSNHTYFFYKQLTRNNSIWRDVLNSEPIMNGKAQTGRFRQSDTDENKGLWFNDPCPHVHSYFYKQSFPCFRFILFSFHWMYAKSTANQQVEIIIL